MQNKCDKCGKSITHVDRCDDCYKCDDCGTRDDLCSYIEGVLCETCHKARVQKRIENFNGDTQYQDNIICPYCGDKNEDSWEVEGDSGEIECDECGNTFEYERDVTVDYTTYKKGG